MTFTDSYGVGRNAEIQVCDILQRLGWKTSLSPGSKGAADVQAENLENRWCIQVKYRDEISSSIISLPEEMRLISHSKKCGCMPIVAIVTSYPGGLLLNASNIRDKKNPFVIRNIYGGFYAIEVDDGTAMFFYNLLNGRKIEP